MDPKDVSFFYNPKKVAPGKGASLANYSAAEAKKVLNYHKGFREYAPTPLLNLKSLAKNFGVGRLYVKDESKRFGLNAFKVLGGAYALGRIVAEKLGKNIEDLSVEEIRSPETKKKTGTITFATATDGNHGRGVAWTAQQLGQHAKVYMPKGSAEIRAQNIRATGAECTITNENYDGAVRMANAAAEKNGWVMVQDTAWEGYEKIPTWIMQGYMTLAIEALEQMRADGVDAPSHLVLQAGVGSYAGAALGYFAATLGDKCPVTSIVEPRLADCIYKSMTAQDGKPHIVTGDMATLMAGLACGEPSTVGWGAIRDYASAAIACEDYFAANGMRILGCPLPGDPQITSGESGACTTGILEYICKMGKDIKEKLGITDKSNILLISTEGDTSPELYRDIVWHGKYQDGGKK